METNIKGEILYLMHDLNSAVGNLKYAKKYILGKEEYYPQDLDKSISIIDREIQKIKDIQDYFYNKVKEKGFC